MSEQTFVASYAALVRDILGLYPTPAPPVLHVCGGEREPCEYIARFVESRSNATSPMAYTTTGDTGVRKGGCVGHRNATQQARLARFLAPAIARVAGWEDAGAVALAEGA